MAVADDEGNFVVGGGDVGLLAAIASMSTLTYYAVLWSGIQEERGQGFGVDPHRRWMVLWDLMLGPRESPVLNDLHLWYLAEVLLKRRRVEFGGNDDSHLRGGCTGGVGIQGR